MDAVPGRVVLGHGLERVEADDQFDGGDADLAVGEAGEDGVGQVQPAVGAAADAGRRANTV